MDKSFLRIQDVPAFNAADSLSDKVWNIIISWDIFSKRTLGEQLVKAFDSISANIAEGFGRHFKKEKIRFYYYARGSTIEAQTWIDKAYRRGLINKKQHELSSSKLNTIPRQINHLINLTRRKLRQ